MIIVTIPKPFDLLPLPHQSLAVHLWGPDIVPLQNKVESRATQQMTKVPNM